MAVIFSVLVFCLSLTAVSSEEPQCSRFHYEEQTLSKMLKMELKMEQLEADFRRLQAKLDERIGAFQDGKSITDRTLTQMENTVERLLVKEGLSTYVRWGGEDCPDNGTDLLYKGYMAGNEWNKYGGGSTSICLPDTPTWAEHVDGYNSGAKIFGTQIEIDSTVSNKLFGTNVHNNDISCALCSSIRETVLMVPGKAECLPGWTMEYQGYLVASHPNWKGSSDYVCLDGEFVKGQDAGLDNEHVIRIVEIDCGVLPCPPYVQGREVACVVCSK